MQKRISHFGFKLKVILVLLITLLNGCNNTKDRTELETYVKQVKNQSVNEIEALPEMKPFDTFTYKAFNKRSPFAPPVQVINKRITTHNGIRPDVNRRKELLENFPLDSLRMVGTVEKEGLRWALVVDNKGTVHRIKKGNFVGQNEGRVDEITEEKVLITEIIPDGNLGWRERKSSLALIEGNEKK